MRCICVSVEADYSLKEYREISDRLCSMLLLVIRYWVWVSSPHVSGIFRFATGVYSPPTLGPRGNLEPSLVYSLFRGGKCHFSLFLALFHDFGTFPGGTSGIAILGGISP